MNLLSAAIGLMITAIVSLSGLEAVNSVISYQQQRNLVAQFRQVYRAVKSYGGSLCGIAGGSTGFVCTSTSMTFSMGQPYSLISAGYLPSGFNFNSLVSRTPTISLSGQNFVVAATLSSGAVCGNVSIHLESASCSGATLLLYVPTVTGSAWTLVNSGRFVYP